MCLIRDYLDATQKWQAERGPRTLVWFQVGLFYEVYALKRPTDEHYTGSAIADFRQIAEVVIVIKKKPATAIPRGNVADRLCRPAS